MANVAGEERGNVVAGLTPEKLNDLAANRQGRCNARAIEHGVSRRYWRALAYGLGITAAAAAGVASLAIFKGAEEGSSRAILGGVLAGVAALLGALDTTILKPQAKAQAHERAGVGFELLRNDWENFRDFVLPAVSVEEARRTAQGLHERQQSLGAASPPISEWARKRRQRR